jgi:anthranilate/para-aminobenzoate synthase component I
LVDVRRLADTRSPAEVIRGLRATPGLVVLHGEWAGGSTIITAHPSATLTDADGIRAACREPLRSLPASSAIGGGWFGWLRYPDSPSGPRTPDDGPGAGDYLGYYPSLLRYRPDVGCWYDEALVSDGSLDARRRDLRLLLRQPSRAAGSAYRVGPMRLRESRAGYTASVKECIEQIRAGQVYQANLCFRMDADFGGDGTALFADLVDALHPAFGALICTSSQAVVSVSPELFLRRRGNTVTSAPIKGTRPKSPTGRDPDPAATELLRSTKERAENVMIVDLVRNDLGRVAATGTVRVPSLLAVEQHCGVWHLVSRVQARLAAGCTDADLLDATFPPASVTGAPKQAARELIAALERRPRGVYTGAIGYVSPSAGLELNVAIRTAVISYHDAGPHRLSLGVGAGITAGSVPDDEWQECLDKAAPLIDAWSGHGSSHPQADGRRLLLRPSRPG